MSEIRKLSMQELNRKSAEEFKQAAKTPVIVILDNVRSMHNIGSVFRTCDAFLVEELLLCGITATPPNKEIHKTALGATETVSWKHFASCQEAAAYVLQKGYALYAVEQAQGSIMLDAFQAPQPLALVFGNEVNGVSQEMMLLAQGVIEIPQIGSKHSLNVSVSAGVLLWEVFRQLQLQKR